MDYEKKYKEALERAKVIYQGSYKPDTAATIAETLQNVFPELCESEDEKIRKELIEHVKDQQSSFISAPDCRDKYEEEENNKYNSWLAWLERQATPQMVEDAFLKGCNDTKKSLLKKQGEKKPAEWSEKDERNLNDAILFIETGTYSLDKDNLINWLKSLRPQNRWKPSDKQMNALDSTLQYSLVSHNSYEHLNSLYNDLKKLTE